MGIIEKKGIFKMFAISHLSTKNSADKEFSIIENSIQTVFQFSDISNDCSHKVAKVFVGECDGNIKKANKIDHEEVQTLDANELCLDIEKNLSDALYQLDGQVVESYSPVVTSTKRCPVYDENGIRKRIR